MAKCPFTRHCYWTLFLPTVAKAHKIQAHDPPDQVTGLQNKRTSRLEGNEDPHFSCEMAATGSTYQPTGQKVTLPLGNKKGGFPTTDQSD